MNRAKEQILSILVYARFTHIPSILQPMIGLNWLAGVVGKLNCFDANTIARNKLVYVKGTY